MGKGEGEREVERGEEVEKVRGRRRGEGECAAARGEWSGVM